MNHDITEPNKNIDLPEIKRQQDELKKVFSTQPKPANVKTNKYAGNSRYLEIGYLEALLDRHFLTWDLRIDSVQLILNAIVVNVTIECMTVAGNKITRSGVGASEVQTVKGAKVLDITTIGSKALEKNVPIAKATAVKNAIQTLGNAYGRNLNRNFNHEHIPDNDILGKVFNNNKQIQE